MQSRYLLASDECVAMVIGDGWPIYNFISDNHTPVTSLADGRLLLSSNDPEIKKNPFLISISIKLKSFRLSLEYQGFAPSYDESMWVMMMNVSEIMNFFWNDFKLRR